MADVDDGDGTAVGRRVGSGRAWRGVEGGLERHGDSLNEGNQVEESPLVTHTISVSVFGSWLCQRPVRILTRESEFGSRAPTYGFNIHVNYCVRLWQLTGRSCFCAWLQRVQSMVAWLCGFRLIKQSITPWTCVEGEAIHPTVDREQGVRQELGVAVIRNIYFLQLCAAY